MPRPWGQVMWHMPHLPNKGGQMGSHDGQLMWHMLHLPNKVVIWDVAYATPHMPLTVGDVAYATSAK